MYICIYSVEAPSHPTITITLFAPASLPLLFSYFFFRTSRGGLASASFQTSPVSSLSFLTIRAALYTHGPFLSRFLLMLAHLRAYSYYVDSEAFDERISANDGEGKFSNGSCFFDRIYVIRCLEILFYII